VRNVGTKERKEKDLVTHNHKNVATKLKQVGLLQDLKNIIDNYFPNGKKREAAMTEATLIENLKTMPLNIQDRRHIATDNEKWENYKVHTAKAKMMIRFDLFKILS
jgi:hypothetical protein